jgi:hypothetical protein
VANDLCSARNIEGPKMNQNNGRAGMKFKVEIGKKKKVIYVS